MPHALTLKQQAPDAIVAFTGYYQFAPREKIIQPRVQSRMLLWCKTGRGNIEVNGQIISLEADDFCFLPWDRFFTYLPDEHEPFLTGGVHLIPYHQRAQKIIFDVAHHQKHPLFNLPGRKDRSLGILEGLQRGSLKDAVQLHHLAEYIVKRFHERDPVEWEARALAQLLLVELYAAKAKRPKNRELPLSLSQMVEFIEHHRERKIGMRDLTRVSRLSVSAVGRMFLRYLKMSPMAFITRDKINYAKFFLATTGKSVGEIGSMSGISDPYYFSKLFRKTTGMAPMEYRRQSSFL